VARQFLRRGDRTSGLPDDRGHFHWLIRLKGEERDVITLWLSLRQRTVFAETELMPAPEENVEALYRYLLVKNHELRELHLAIGPEAGIYLVTQVPIGELTVERMDELVGATVTYVDDMFPTVMSMGLRRCIDGDAREIAPCSVDVVAYKLVIIGAGRMGSALAEGLLRRSGASRANSPSLARSVESRARPRESIPGVGVFASLEVVDVDAHTGRHLAVKPDHAEGISRLAGAVGIVTRVLSVVAGLSTARIEAAFPGPVAVIRSMPNTPVLIGQGVTAMAGGAHVTSDDLDWAESILGAVGTVVRVTERNLDAVTGLSGPMPAYLYLVVEALIEAGVHQGSRATSRARWWLTPSPDRGAAEAIR
jgi:pyrroline-5-carboxylate reductase